MRSSSRAYVLLLAPAIVAAELAFAVPVAVPIQRPAGPTSVNEDSAKQSITLRPSESSLKLVGLTEELRKAKDKIQGKDHPRPNEDAASPANKSAEPCRPNKDMTVEILKPRPGWQPEILVHNNSSRRANAIVHVEATNKIETTKNDYNTLDISAHGSRMIAYGGVARIATCKFSD